MRISTQRCEMKRTLVSTASGALFQSGTPLQTISIRRASAARIGRFLSATHMLRAAIQHDVRNARALVECPWANVLQHGFAQGPRQRNSLRGRDNVNVVKVGKTPSSLAPLVSDRLARLHRPADRHRPERPAVSTYCRKHRTGAREAARAPGLASASKQRAPTASMDSTVDPWINFSGVA